MLDIVAKLIFYQKLSNPQIMSIQSIFKKKYKYIDVYLICGFTHFFHGLKRGNSN